MARCCLLVAVVLAESSLASLDCGQVRVAFVDRAGGTPRGLPDRPVPGGELTFCPSMETCCSQSMEEQYNEAVKKDFKNMLRGAGAYLKTLISTSATKFRDTFLDMVSIAENSCNALFADVYKSLESSARVPMGQLFADLLAYISGQSVDLEERVNSFFESLFPLAYQHSMTMNQDFSDGFRECLRERQSEIRPFSNLPDKVSTQISRSFQTARTFLQALHLGVEVINTTEHMDFGLECRKALVHLTYCPHCQGHVRARPCAGMCLNVIRGCLASVSELDSSWSEYVSALERLTSAMVGIYNIEQVLSNLDNKISESVMYVSENSEEISKRVKQKCGTLRRSLREVSPVTSNPPSARPLADTSLYIMLQNFVRKLAESKDFYSNLADRLCSDGNLVVKGELRCWNGSDLGEYTQTVAGIGVSAQKYNPEMKPPSVLDGVIKRMADKLQHIKLELSNQVTSVPQSDDSVLFEGSGNDYDDASGSGDFQKEADLHFDSSERNSPVSGATWALGSSTIFLLLCFTGLRLWWQ